MSDPAKCMHANLKTCSDGSASCRDCGADSFDMLGEEVERNSIGAVYAARIAGTARPMELDPVEVIRATKCDHHGSLFGNGCDGKPVVFGGMFCRSRIRAALAMPRGEAAESFAASPPPSSRLRFDMALVEVVATFFGDTAGRGWNTGHLVAELLDRLEAAGLRRPDTRTAERSEALPKRMEPMCDGITPPGTPRACETCKGKKRVPWPHESTVATMRTGNPATSGTVPCPTCTGGR